MLELFASIWDASRGSLEVIRSNLRQKYFRDLFLSKKCLGGSRMVLGVPRTTLKHITNKNRIFSINTNYFVGDPVFCWEKTPAGAARPSKRGWSYPITFRSLVVKHTAPTQIFDRTFDIFLTFFEIVWEHLGCIQGVVRGR